MTETRAATLPWHGVGVDLEGVTDAREALHRAGLAWTVSTVPVHGPDNVPIPGYRAVVRDDTRQPLGVVGPSWEPIQNGEMISLAESIVNESGATFLSGGAAKGGRLAWLLLDLPGVVDIAGDEVRQFLLLTNSHDASRALRACITPMRVRCSNALRVAEARGNGMLSIRHTSSASAQLVEARRVLAYGVEEVAGFRRTAETLASRAMTTHEIRQFGEALFPLQGDETEERRGRVLAVRRSIADKVDGLGIGLDAPGIRGTRWAALNAVAELIDHDRRYRSPEGRFRSILLDDGAVMKRRALEWLTRN